MGQEVSTIGGVSIHPGPASVRLALPSQAEQIATIQRLSMARNKHYKDLLTSYSDEQMSTSWREAILRPPLATMRILVADDGDGTLVGFAVVGPNDDPDADISDAELVEWHLHPEHRESDHADRLMHAVIDTVRADGFSTIRHWLATDDDSHRKFLTDLGWAADQAHREIGTEDGHLRLRQIRMHTCVI